MIPLFSVFLEREGTQFSRNLGPRIRGGGARFMELALKDKVVLITGVPKALALPSLRPLRKKARFR